MRDKDDDLIPPGLRVSPPGMPSLICKICGGPKAPKQACRDCIEAGRTWRGRVAKSPAEQQKFIRARRRYLVLLRIKERERQRSPQGRKRGRGKWYERRLFEVKEYDRLLEGILQCFERDPQGVRQIYKDKMPRLRKLLDEAEVILERLRKRYMRQR